MDSSGQQRMTARDVGTSARRRRERRLRAQWRHEQQSIAMALAAAQHHSAPKSAGPVSHNVLRNQNTAREGSSTPTFYGTRTLPGREFYAMSEDSDVVVGGRPPSLVDVRPQERLQQRTEKQIDQLVEVPTNPGYALAVVAVQTLGWRDARALLEQLNTARPGRDTNTGHRDGG